MKTTYTQAELDDILQHVEPRQGWDFSRMNTICEPVPWDYIEEVKKYLHPEDDVLDIGTGGGERFITLAPHLRSGVGIDVDEEMVKIAQQNADAVANMMFMVLDEKLEVLNRSFNVIINRHAPFDLEAIKSHMLPGGYFITQQVGEKNMRNIKTVLGKPIGKPVITKAMIETSGLQCIDFREYDVQYVVEDVESLVFWLNALDMLHADMAGTEALQSVEILNGILANNVDKQGFVTNEHRYLAVAQL